MQSQNIYGWFLIGTSARNKYGNYGTEIYDEKNPLKAFFGTSEEKSTDNYEDPELITIGLSMSFYPNVIQSYTYQTSCVVNQSSMLKWPLLQNCWKIYETPFFSLKLSFLQGLESRS